MFFDFVILIFALLGAAIVGYVAHMKWPDLHTRIRAAFRRVTP